MTLSELSGKISSINARVQQVNNERQMNMGKYETLKTQLDSAMEKYSKQYGVELTSDNLMDEVNRVSSVLEEQANKMEKVLGCINAKDYAGAEALLGVKKEPEKATPVDVSGGLALDKEVGIYVGSADVVDEPSVEKPVTEKPVTENPVGAGAMPSQAIPPVFERPVKGEAVQEPARPQFSQPKQGGLNSVAKFGALPMDDEDDMPAPPPAPPNMNFSTMSRGKFNPAR